MVVTISTATLITAFFTDRQTHPSLIVAKKARSLPLMVECNMVVYPGRLQLRLQNIRLGWI